MVKSAACLLALTLPPSKALPIGIFIHLTVRVSLPRLAFQWFSLHFDSLRENLGVATTDVGAYGGCQKFLLLFGRIGPLALRPCALLRAWGFFTTFNEYPPNSMVIW